MTCYACTMRRFVMLALVLALGCNDRPRGHSAAAPTREPAATPDVLPPSVEVRFYTSDGVAIVGTLQPAAHADAPAVVLVHQLGSDRREWAPLVERLGHASSLTTLAIDLRGHGGSTTSETGSVLSYDAFDANAWANTERDVRAAVTYLHDTSPDVTPTHVAAVGASIGGTAVLAAAALDPRIEHLVVLSPGRAYHGFDGITPAMSLGDRPLLAVVARDEEDNVETANALGRLTHGEPMIVEGSAHGIGLFDVPGVLDRTETFLREALGAPRRADAPR